MLKSIARHGKGEPAVSIYTLSIICYDFLQLGEPETRRAQMNKERRARFEKLNFGNEEFCVVCLEIMGFPKSVHIDSQLRLQGGA